MEMLIPWDKLVEAIKPCYPQAGKGRAPYPLENMWERVQLFYNLSDPATQDMLYEIESVRRFTGTCRNKVPDKRTILNFRHLLERHGLGKVLFESIKEYLAEEGPKMTRAALLSFQGHASCRPKTPIVWEGQPGPGSRHGRDGH